MQPQQLKQLGTTKFDELDALNQQHFSNMFDRLCRGVTITRRIKRKRAITTKEQEEGEQQNRQQEGEAQEEEVEEKVKVISRSSLPTLLGSIGLISPPPPQPQQHHQHHQQEQLSEAVSLEDAISSYDEAVDYVGHSMAECMELFAMLDDDGDGVVDVGALKAALCSDGKPGTSGGISEAEFYYALDSAKLLTGPSIALSNFDTATGSRLDMLKVDDDLHEEEAGGDPTIPPATAENAHLTGTIVPKGLTVYQFLNVILRFQL